MKIIRDIFPEHVSGMELNNGAVMPQIGLGVFEIKDGELYYHGCGRCPGESP